MPVSLDLNLLPIARYAGQDYPDLLSLHVAEPPRRAQRARLSDRLILYLAMSGNAPLPPGKQEQMLADSARLYYNTPGSVTAALRAVAEELNKTLLERNLRIASTGRQGTGIFSQVVLRDGQIILALSGPAHAFLIADDQAQDFYNSEMEGCSLGLARQTPISFYQASLKPNDTLILSAMAPPVWDISTMSSLHVQGPESLRRKLFGQNVLDLNAVIIQAKAGQGKFFVRPLTSSSKIGSAELFGEEPQAATSSNQAAVPPAAPVKKDVEFAEEKVIVEANRASIDQMAPFSPPHEEKGSEESGEAVQRTRSDERHAMGIDRASMGKWLNAPWMLLRIKGGQLLRGFGRFLTRLLPAEPFASVPSTLMALLAVAVPVVIVAIASATYFQLGLAAQYDLLLSQAKDAAVQAVGQSDSLAKRASWQIVLDTVQKAETFRSTAETQALREQARNALDDLDLVRRLDYQPAIVGGLPAAVKVIRLAISGADLYMLDENSGSVLRARLTGRGYEQDTSFQCGPNVPVVSLTGPLVDMVAWPAGYKPEASVLALADNGGLLYCQSGKPPVSSRLAVPKTGVWGKPNALSLDLVDLYILDPPSNAVWVYWDNKFNEQPSLFFDAQVPELQSVVSMAVSRGDLYLLHADGRVTLCVYGRLGVAPTRCTDVPYIDARPGRENAPLLPEDSFSQVLYTAPPDPSLLFLEPKNQAVYHFSLRSLVFQRQFLPQKMLSPSPATAFTVNMVNRTLFLAINNQVYYAALP